MIVLDTGGLYAALDANEALHDPSVAILATSRPPRILSPFVLAELDYLIGQRVGHEAQMALLARSSAAFTSSTPSRGRTSSAPARSWRGTPTCESGWLTRR